MFRFWQLSNLNASNCLKLAAALSQKKPALEIAKYDHYYILYQIVSYKEIQAIERKRELCVSRLTWLEKIDRKRDIIGWVGKRWKLRASCRRFRKSGALIYENPQINTGWQVSQWRWEA